MSAERGNHHEHDSKEVKTQTLCASCSRVFSKSSLLKHFADLKRGNADHELLRDHDNNSQVHNVGILSTNPILSEPLFHSQNLQQIVASSLAPDACHICSMVCKDLSRRNDENHIKSDGIIQARFQLWSAAVGEDPVLCLCFERITDLQVLSEAASLSAAGHHDHERLNQLLVVLEESLKATDQIECISQAPSRVIPTRLVDVGEVAPGQPAPPPRLFLPPTHCSQLQYLTLSHSWAKSKQSLNLLTENLKELQVGIPLTAVSQAFRDAIDITRRLGHRYIWINSLCLIQNSREDWEREAVTMGHVYGNSACNIAVLGMDGVDGCFSLRNPLEIIPCRIQADNLGTGRSVYVLPQLLRTDYSLSAFRRPPLLRRGWVLQEQPSYPFSSKGKFRALCNSSSIDSQDVAEAPKLISDRNLLLYHYWQDTLCRYTEANLTFPTDRFVALAGIVKTFQRHSGFTYVHGTWREFWPLDLLWEYFQVRRPGETGFVDHPETGLKVPSWSWAAKEGIKRFALVLHPDYQGSVVIEYLAPVVGTGTDDKGDITTINFLGPVLRGVVVKRSGGRKIQVRLDDGHEAFMLWDAEPEDGDEVLLVLLALWKRKDFHHDADEEEPMYRREKSPTLEDTRPQPAQLQEGTTKAAWDSMDWRYSDNEEAVGYSFLHINA
ncbi:heterokaryon incompatibility protein-domain-containing protein [Pseudoneurospora amorphoporcata]|uniref:Heterokaryon incompatibility protein-domain-containing protein n=1 Tax=Pseudoneurospora amorphoporcata TaxID=241081 RepID=A0AAN6NZZ5_9PEZI|nr:heterokaryon incompatibility protein-domain-containing protein [Pseudoneurospora amorphoporcata]